MGNRLQGLGGPTMNSTATTTMTSGTSPIHDNAHPTSPPPRQRPFSFSSFNSRRKQHLQQPVEEEDAAPETAVGFDQQQSAPQTTTMESHVIAVAFGKPFLLRWEPVLSSFHNHNNYSSQRRTTPTIAKSLIKAFFAKKQFFFSSFSSSSTAMTMAQPPLDEPSTVERPAQLPSTLDIGFIPKASSRFWCASEISRECSLGDMIQTSLLTFHSRNANAVNLKGTTEPLVSVQNEDIVTVYANVGNGRYLYRESSGKLRFTASPQDVRTNRNIAEGCEFIARRQGNLGEDHHTELHYEEKIVLECNSQPRGHFLAVTLVDNVYHLVSTPHLHEAHIFEMHSPTLRELVQLNATKVASQHSSVDGTNDFLLPDFAKTNNNDFELVESKIQQERDQEWMDAIAARLPVHLAKRIFEYHFDWTRTARLCCKEWKHQAERNIRRIRVNGEFCSLETEEERGRLIDFVQRCPKLEVLTLRNVMTLTDDDIAKIADNKNLHGLVLGGCRRLSDKSTREIAQKLGPRLDHLNMAFTNITDESLRIVAESAENIRELNLYNCTRVTVDGVNRSADIESGLHCLEHINLRGTVVDSHLVQNFRRKRPDVVVLTGPASADSIWG